MNARAQPRERPLPWSQVAAFRLARHHLLDRTAADLEAVCRDVSGIQAQVMSCAALACGARLTGITPDTMHSALWKSRTLVKTLCMRRTLHLLPAADLSIYIAALKRSRLAAILRGMAVFGMGEKDLHALNGLVVEALRSGPMAKRDLAQAIRPRVNKKVQAWMKAVWSIASPALLEGLICYGSEQDVGKGNEAVFVRVDQWLPKQKKVDESAAQQILLRNYLRAYGPANVQDFSFWSGISMKDSREVWNSVAQDLVEVSIEGQKMSILSQDLNELAEGSLDEDVVRLLPAFDSYVLAHAKKDHMLKDQYYKRVYRNQGWISPVVLINGRIAGIWSCVRKGKALLCNTELFERAPKRLRSKIHDEGERLGQFLGAPISISLSA